MHTSNGDKAGRLGPHTPGYGHPNSNPAHGRGTRGNFAPGILVPRPPRVYVYLEVVGTPPECLCLYPYPCEYLKVLGIPYMYTRGRAKRFSAGAGPAVAYPARPPFGGGGEGVGERIKWDKGGPRGSAHWVPVVKLGAGDCVRLVCVSGGVCGIWLHWIAGRTVPCLDAAGECPYHSDSAECGLRWKGYVATVRARGHAVEYAGLTAEGWRLCPLLRELSDAGELRGVELCLSRSRAGPRRPVLVSLPNGEGRVSWWKSLPPAPDVQAAVLTLMRQHGPEWPLASKGE